MNHINSGQPCETLSPRTVALIAESERRRLQDRQAAFLSSFGTRRWSEGSPEQPEALEREIEALGDVAGEGPAYRREGPPEPSPEPSLLSIHESKSVPTGDKGLTGVLTGEAAGQLFKRLDRYGRAVGQRGPLVEYLRTEAVGQAGKVPTADRAERLASCGSWLEFRHFFTHPEQLLKLSSGIFCQQHLMCPLCAIRRAAKMLRHNLPKIMTAIEPGMRLYFVTFTQPVGPNLREQWNKQNGYFRKFVAQWKNSRNARGRTKRRKASFLINGGVFSFEAKRAEGTRGDGGWHVHNHGLAIADGQLDPAAIAAEWVDVTDGLANVEGQHVRELDSMVLFDSEESTEQQLQESTGRDLIEVFKYPMKFSSLEPADQWQAFNVLLGRRLMRTFGSLYRLEADERFLEEPLQLQDLPYVRLIFRHLEGKYSLDRRIFIDSINKP